jgi:hypothetical protein
VIAIVHDGTYGEIAYDGVKRLAYYLEEVICLDEQYKQGRMMEDIAAA